MFFIVFVFLSRCCLTFCTNPFDEIDLFIEEIKRGNEELRQENANYEPIPDHIDSRWDQLKRSQAIVDPVEYDFIVVGGGASGSVLANRLSEIPEWKVLLLEAGGEGNVITNIPDNTMLLQRSHYNWGYRTTPQKNWCFQNKDRRCDIEAGKVLGGSTVINGMIVTRGNPQDYEAWADQGVKGWCWRSVFPYYLKMEDANLTYYDGKYHRKGGLLSVETPKFLTPAADILIQAAGELNIPFIDQNGRTDRGFGLMQGTTRDGVRDSADTAYVEPARTRSNLMVKTRSYVTKILIDSDTKEANGVQYIQGGKLRLAKATKEVVVSAGGIGSPKLLLLSGIGPKDHLLSLQIEPIVESPVGQELKDHLGFQGIRYFFDQIQLPPRNEDEEIYQYLKDHSGPLTGYGIEAIGFFKNDSNQPGTPDYELLYFPIRENDTQGVMFLVATMHPKSVGSLKLSSNDPIQPPLVDLNHFTDEGNFDLDVTLLGTRLALKYQQTEAFKKNGGRLDRTKPPGCENLPYDSDIYWVCAIKHQSISFRHYITTCKMGSNNDPSAVVDEHLRVYGVKNLRVADNSVIPVTISGHLMTPAYMIGEKGADIIKNYWL